MQFTFCFAQGKPWLWLLMKIIIDHVTEMNLEILGTKSANWTTWRDVFQDCSLTFYILFYQFEEDGKLDPDNHQHVKILQFCFSRLYNARLMEWMEGCNHLNSGLQDPELHCNCACRNFILLMNRLKYDLFYNALHVMCAFGSAVDVSK